MDRRTFQNNLELEFNISQKEDVADARGIPFSPGKRKDSYFSLSGPTSTPDWQNFCQQTSVRGQANKKIDEKNTSKKKVREDPGNN
jgi:hypothetical protein